MVYNSTRVITLEEHYWDAEMSSHFPLGERVSHVKNLLLEVGEVRLKAMDEAGIDVQVLSHGAPSSQKLDPAIAVDLTKRTNDRLATFCSRHSKRFFGFAAIPTTEPDAAARELERCVKDLGFKGAMVHGLTHGHFLDEKQFWPIFEMAEKLDVPIYLHPSVPDAEVSKRYYDDYGQEFPTVIRPAWGFTVETATVAIRLILSRVFEKHKNLKIILGHLGEALPYLMWRINQSLARPGQKSLNFQEVFCRHFYVTTSGNFSTPALLCAIQELGIDNIMFSVDYPYVTNSEGVDWVKSLQINPQDKVKLLSGNAAQLLRL